MKVASIPVCPGKLLLSLLAVGTSMLGCLAAQTPPDRSMLAATLSGVHSSSPTGTTHCRSDVSDVKRLCQAIVFLAGDRGDHIKASDLAVRAVVDQGHWPYAWLVVGTVRLQLARDSALSREGPAEGTGMSNVLGAANAFEEALKIEPGFEPAANALALTPEPREGVTALATRLLALRQTRSLLSGPALAGAAIIERDAGSTDSAIALEQRALVKGDADSGVVYLSLARDYHHVGKPAEGYHALIAGAAPLVYRSLSFRLARQQRHRHFRRNARRYWGVGKRQGNLTMPAGPSNRM
jgi:hypothetical protein